jgi:hypothetical protein
MSLTPFFSPARPTLKNGVWRFFRNLPSQEQPTVLPENEPDPFFQQPDKLDDGLRNLSALEKRGLAIFRDHP